MTGRQAGRARGLKLRLQLGLGIAAAALVLGAILAGQARREDPRLPPAGNAPREALALANPPGEDRVAEPTEGGSRREGPHTQKTAALNRAYETEDDAAFRALLGTGVDADQRQSVVRFLTKRARFDPRARRLLGEFAGSEAGEEERRSEAAATVLRWGDDAELAPWAGKLYLERDPARMERAIRALAENNAESARALIVGLAGNHPDPEIRHRAEEQRSGRFCPEHTPCGTEE